jgi:hypothetical protein
MVLAVLSCKCFLISDIIPVENEFSEMIDVTSKVTITNETIIMNNFIFISIIA